MTEKELGDLERDVTSLLVPEDRDEALKDLAELRAAQSHFEPQAKARSVPNSPDFKGLNRILFAKLLFGSMAFLGLCAALVFLVFPVGSLLAGVTSPGVLSQLITAISATAAFVALLYVLGRKSREERDVLEGNFVARRFSRQKLLFQILALGLLAATILIMVAIASPLSEYRTVVALVMTFGFFFGYWLLGRMFWRCPACGHQLSFMNKNVDRQSIHACPNCHATLQ